MNKKKLKLKNLEMPIKFSYILKTAQVNKYVFQSARKRAGAVGAAVGAGLGVGAVLAAVGGAAAVG